MSILQMVIAARTPLDRHLSFAATLISTAPQCAFFHSKLSPLSLRIHPTIGPIRMGGKTYPGGVSKEVWRRTQSRKRKKLKRDGIALERQIYERRKRAELKSAIPVLELPLESVDKSSMVFPKRDEEHLKVLNNRFQKPDGTERRSGNRLPADRVYPKRVNQSYDSAEDLVQEFYSKDEKIREDVYLNRRMESRSGQFDYLIKGLLSEDESQDELELKVLADRFQKSDRTELSRTDDLLLTPRCHPKWVNQSDSVQEGRSHDDGVEESNEEINRIRSGKFNYLMKDLLIDDESEDQLDS